MLFHKFDPSTKIFIESVESDQQPEHSTDKALPEITEHYTVAFIDDQWVSVLKPDFEIVDNVIGLSRAKKEEIAKQEQLSKETPEKE